MSAHTLQAYPGRHHALQSGRRPRKRTHRTHLTDCIPLANLQDRMRRYAHYRSIHHPTYRHTAHQSGQQPVQGPAALNHLPMSRRRSHTTHTTQPSTDESQTQSYPPLTHPHSWFARVRRHLSLPSLCTFQFVFLGSFVWFSLRCDFWFGLALCLVEVFRRHNIWLHAPVCT